LVLKRSHDHDSVGLNAKYSLSGCSCFRQARVAAKSTVGPLAAPPKRDSGPRACARSQEIKTGRCPSQWRSQVARKPRANPQLKPSARLTWQPRNRAHEISKWIVVPPPWGGERHSRASPNTTNRWQWHGSTATARQTKAPSRSPRQLLQPWHRRVSPCPRSHFRWNRALWSRTGKASGRCCT